MQDCFFLHDQMINCDMTNYIVLHFYAGIEENDIFFFLRNLKFVASYLENGLVDFVDTQSFFSIFKTLSNKSNLYFACSSPLRDIAGGHIH